jgi:RNA polymerase sigma-70 factor (ECF subfamily)
MWDNRHTRMRPESDEEEQRRWEHACVQRARAGEREAFAALYRAFAPKLYEQVLVPKLGDARAAEDALSETFRTLLEQLHELETEQRSLWPWLCRVASNKAIDMHRKRARTQRALVSFEGQLAPLMEQSDVAQDFELHSDRAALQGAVASVLEALNPRYRRAIELRFIEEHGRERCAELMALKLGTFDVLLLRALRAFRHAWELHFRDLARGTP